MTLSGLNHPFNTINPTSRDALQFRARNAIQDLSDHFKKTNLIGDLPSDQRALYFSK
jgi:hypothetical protein